ncbi:MAG: helix-turn-helix domain-containing protein, partial [Prevotella sp.]
YIYVAVAVMNYCFDGDFFLVPAKGLATETSYHKGSPPSPQAASNALVADEGSEVTEPTFDALEQALNAWVIRREFTKRDVSTDEVAEHLHATRQQLAAYFKTVHNTTFRSWRQQLRLEYAQTLIHDNPDLPLAHLHELVGFNDRSNFHNAFRKFTGTTPQEYRDSVK